MRQADVGVAMHSGTNAAKEAGNLIDLDSDPTKLLDLSVSESRCWSPAGLT
jgi:K+-transporting ATPase ATPase B chain